MATPVRAPGGRRARRARAGGRAGGGDRPGHRRRASRARDRGGRRARAFVAESLVEALAETPVQRALVARARGARDVLPDALRARGAEVDVLELYETVAEPLSTARPAGGARRRLHHVHLLVDGALLLAGSRHRHSALPCHPLRLDRTGDQRDPARARPAGRRRGRAARCRWTGSGARAGRSGRASRQASEIPTIESDITAGAADATVLAFDERLAREAARRGLAPRSAPTP